MALLSAHRRRFGLFAVGLLLLAMIGAFFPDRSGTWRPFRPPSDRTSAFAWPGAIADAWRRYFQENFGYARSLPLLRGAIGYRFESSSDPRVFFGHNGRLYLNAEGELGQTTGTLYRSDEIGQFVDTMDTLQRALARTGAKLVVMVAPNAQSVATGDLPSWWHVSGPLEYDLALRELRLRSITTIDTKALLRALPDRDSLYRKNDAHWRRSAALIAFNAAMLSIGHPDWTLDPARTIGPLAPAPPGDLARLVGLQDYVEDSDYVLRLDLAENEWRRIDVLKSPPFLGVFYPWAFERAPEGERILVMGDSFTQLYWQPLLMHTTAARIGWMHHARCNFDYTDVVRFQPSVVIVVPAERYLPCQARS